MPKQLHAYPSQTRRSIAGLQRRAELLPPGIARGVRRDAIRLTQEKARLIEHSSALRSAGGPDEASVNRAAVDVAQVTFIAIESTSQAAEWLFDVVGALTTGRSRSFDRHWGNAGTVARHNPRDWKAVAVGAHRLKGAERPLPELFRTCSLSIHPSFG